eukprot:comp21038_c0_seq2/m.28272 comp21038_c0_seq2/g.28272  ORF comp21038_c0_seq2/g.28272 comp21038_c0_seq2/m.28272 type:complete len:120 (-) comp21038_c0_seq2:334-693(-)
MCKALARELMHVPARYKVVCDEARSFPGQTAVLMATLVPSSSVPHLPPLRLRVPWRYPLAPPLWSFDPAYGCAQFLRSVQRTFEARACALPTPITVTMLLELLEDSTAAIVHAAFKDDE